MMLDPPSMSNHCTIGKCPLRAAIKRAVKPLESDSVMFDPPSVSNHCTVDKCPLRAAFKRAVQLLDFNSVMFDSS